MVLNPDLIKEEAYQFFVQEALELLQRIEADLLTLRHDRGIPKIHNLVRAADSLKKEAASVGLTNIQTLADRLENAFRAFYGQGTEIDLELEELLLQAYFCLRLPLLAQIHTGKYDDAVALVKAKPVFTQLEVRLGHTLGAGADLPTGISLGVDVTESIFAIDVTQHLEHMEIVLANPEAQDVAEALRTKAQALACVGKLFNLPGFVEIARTALVALQIFPQAAAAIGQLALEDFRAARLAVLQGDRIQGGMPSPAWAEFAAHSQVDVLDRTAIAVANPPIPALSPELPLTLVKGSDVESLGQEVIQSGLPVAPELRLTTTQLFVCMVDDLAFITVPFHNIAGILNPQADQVKQVGKQRFLHWRERMIPVYRLSELLDYARPLPKATPTPNSPVLTMLVFSQDNQTCALELKIDRLVTEPELAIKAFGAAITPPRYIYGCTILEAGRLMPVIDGAALLCSPPTLLVVDDSITVRKILDFTLRQAGYRVLQAQNGREAIEQLQQNPTVQLVICDVEMPNMNGFEFLNHRRQDPQLAKIPTVMLTSQISDQHQQLAMELGACAYFRKPYVEQELLAALKTILNKG